MATSHVTRPPQQAVPKAALYAAIADLNRDLDAVLDDFRRLRELRFRREFMDAFMVKIEDLRCWSNSELLETQHDRELKDWAHWGRLNRRFDQRYRDPEDVLLEADLIRKQRAAKKTPGKAR